MTVRASLGQLFVRNWPIKLAALFFAIMLYVAVAAQQPLSQTFVMRLAIAIPPGRTGIASRMTRSEEHTSELQSRLHLVCRLLLEKKKNTNSQISSDSIRAPRQT